MKVKVKESSFMSKQKVAELARLYFNVKQKSDKFQKQLFPFQKPLKENTRKEIGRSVWRVIFKKYNMKQSSRDSGNMSKRLILEKIYKMKLFELMKEQMKSINKFSSEILDQIDKEKFQSWSELHYFFFMCSIYEIEDKINLFTSNPKDYQGILQISKKNRNKNKEYDKLLEGKSNVFQPDQNNDKEIEKNGIQNDDGIIFESCLDLFSFYQDDKIVTNKINEKEQKHQQIFEEIHEFMQGEFIEQDKPYSGLLAIHQSEQHSNNVRGKMEED